MKGKRIDLTKTQLLNSSDDSANYMDDFDLLDAKIDLKDLKSIDKVTRLEQEIEFEKTKLKTKFIFKFSFQSNDPMKITE